jgi:hypothetical protein
MIKSTLMFPALQLDFIRKCCKFHGQPAIATLKTVHNFHGSTKFLHL